MIRQSNLISVKAGTASTSAWAERHIDEMASHEPSAHRGEKRNLGLIRIVFFSNQPDVAWQSITRSVVEVWKMKPSINTRITAWVEELENLA